jgi:probable rRNA maturation factor
MTDVRAAARSGRLRVAVTNGRGGPHPAARSLGSWLERHAPRSARGTVAVALVSDGRMQALNRTFRSVDQPTDVLSFPADPETVEAPTFRSAHPAGPKTGRFNRLQPQAPGLKPQAPIHLGDLAIAVGVARRQARAHGHDLGTELRILALHGLLHLLGYDHEQDTGTMRTLEERLRRRAGLPAGLIARTPRHRRRPLHR